MNRNHQFPHLTEALVQALERAWPLRNPRMEQPIEQIMYEAGQRSVVESLRARLDRQEKVNL